MAGEGEIRGHICRSYSITHGPPPSKHATRRVTMNGWSVLASETNSWPNNHSPRGNGVGRVSSVQVTFNLGRSR